jgi:hypothetical protein
MDKYYEIEYNGNSIYIKNTYDEPINILYDRWYFILKYYYETKTEWNIVNNLSFIYINVKYYHCKYPQFLFTKIEKYL